MSENRVPIKNLILSSIPRKQSNNNAIQSYQNSTPNENKKTLTLMPSKFRNADGDSSFSLGRKQFLKTYVANQINNINNLTEEFEKKGYNCKKNCSHTKCSKNNSTNNNGKYIGVQTSEQRMQRIKNEAIGSGTFGIVNREKLTTELSLRGDNNLQQQQLRKLRNRGSVVPPGVVRHRNPSGSCFCLKKINMENNSGRQSHFRRHGR